MLNQWQLFTLILMFIMFGSVILMDMNARETVSPETVVEAEAFLWRATLENSDGTLREVYVVTQTYEQVCELLFKMEGDLPLIYINKVPMPLMIQCDDHTKYISLNKEET